MLRRIGRVVLDVRTHTALARELSVGLMEAIHVLARGRVGLGDELDRHHARIQSELPGF